MHQPLGRVAVAMIILAASGCASSQRRAQVERENETLRRTNAGLQRTVRQHEAAIARLQAQITNLQGFAKDRPADLFAPTKVEIASLTGGADYDGNPGDDGVTVYLRPRDAAGDVVKAPGRITVQLLENSNLSTPEVVGVYPFHDPALVRRAWHGRFGTNHYTLECPFPPEFRHPASGRLTVSVEFVDFLTGATLTAVTEVKVSPPATSNGTP